MNRLICFAKALALFATVVLYSGTIKADLVDEVCGQSTATSVTDVKVRAAKDSVFGVEMTPLPEITYDAKCKAPREITRCSYDKAVVEKPNRSDGSPGTSDWFPLKSPAGYECQLKCHHIIMAARLSCYVWPKGVCAGKTSGSVTAAKVQMREFKDTADVAILPSPTVSYDADCATMKITKCSVAGHTAVPNAGGGISEPFSIVVSRETHKFVLLCTEKGYAKFEIY